MKKKRLIDLIPFFVMIAATIIALCIYLVPMHGKDFMKVFTLFVCLIASLIIPLVNIIFKIRIPFVFNCLFALFCLFSMNLGSVLRLYDYIPYYDKFLHTIFGFIGSFGIFVLLTYGKGTKMKPWCFFVVIMLGVVGIAGFWEITEYVCDVVAGSNMQRWLPEMSEVGNMPVCEFFKSYNPMWDTIWDMIVAIIGVLLFYLFVFIDKLCGYKVCKSIYNQVLNGKQEKLTETQNNNNNETEENKTTENKKAVE